MKDYNMDNCVEVSVGDETVILSRFNYNEASNTFWDSVIGKEFKVDNIKLKVSDVGEYETIDDKFKPLIADLNNYLNDKFPGETAVAIYPQQEDVNVIINSQKFKPNNFWFGKWNSVYKYNAKEQELTGEIKIDIHFYEDGNIRLKDSKTFKQQDVALDKITEAIELTENNYQKSLNSSFIKLNEKSFKSLRRQLPITRSKINWESINKYKIGENLNN